MELSYENLVLKYNICEGNTGCDIATDGNGGSLRLMWYNSEAGFAFSLMCIIGKWRGHVEILLVNLTLQAEACRKGKPIPSTCM